MACTTQQQTFINNWLNCAKHASYRASLPVSFILAHWGLETAWGTQGGLCSPSCNNPGNLLVGDPRCSCNNNVSAFSTKAAGVNAYINNMNTNYAYVREAWNLGGGSNLEAAKAIGAGCEPGSSYPARIYAESRYNRVVCPADPRTEVANNCYLDSTYAANNQRYSTCAPTIQASPCADCSTGCGYVGCNLYNTINTDCLSPYNYIALTDTACS